MIYAIAGLCVVVVFQQVYFLWQIQKLVNKIMSGSYQSFVNAEKPKVRLKIDDVPNEDLSALADFS
jgi:hypothetical protein